MPLSAIPEDVRRVPRIRLADEETNTLEERFDEAKVLVGSQRNAFDKNDFEQFQMLSGTKSRRDDAIGK